jgi:hypothetical protein
MAKSIKKWIGTRKGSQEGIINNEWYEGNEIYACCNHTTV